MISDITIGQYFPGRTCIHKLDPRMKIVLMIASIVIILTAKNTAAIGVAVAFTLVLVLMTRVPFKMYFKGLKAIWFIIIFTSLFNIFYINKAPFIELGFISISIPGILQSIFIGLRLIAMILISCVLTYTTSPTQLTDAIERLLKPLKLFKVKVHELAMMMTIALRFIPTLLEETEKIMNAQKARGADMESGKFKDRIKAMVPILIPLFVSSIRRAYELAIAMDCRCYHGGEGRTRMKSLHLKFRDYVALLLTVGFGCAIFFANRLPIDF